MQEEIELIDVLRVLWKRRSLIILGTLISALIGLGASLLLPKVYEVSVLLEPGKIPTIAENGRIVERDNVESPEAIKEAILSGAYDEFLREQLSLTDRPEFKVSIPSNTSIIKVVLQSGAPEQAAQILKNLTGQIRVNSVNYLEVAKKNLESLLALANTRYANVQDKIKLVESQVAELGENALSMEREQKKSISKRSADALPAIMYRSEVQDKKIYIASLQEKLADLDLQLQEAKVEVKNLTLAMSSVVDVRLIKMPTIPDDPIRPQKALVVAVAFVIGLMGTTLLAFLLEYLRGVKSTELTA